MKRKNFIIVSLLFIAASVSCQSISDKGVEEKIYVASWNVENLFDTVDNPDKNDEWYTPLSEINWTLDKMDLKLKNLSKVIEFMNNGKGPDIIGLQEVENYGVLEGLIDKINLNRKYRIIHYDSPDARGIDNALIYDSNLFNVVHSEALNVELEDEKTTRDILYAVLNNSSERFHIYVNHWPSRREGLKVTEKRRIKAAEALKRHLLSLDNPSGSNIIIMGDFNDLPSNISLKEILGADNFDCSKKAKDSLTIFNLTYEKFTQGEGTYKYKDHWNMLDQILISNSLLDKSNMDYVCNSFEIVKPEFIIQKDGKYKGTSLPTFGGRKYLGGYSDHFAVGAYFSAARDK